MQVHQKCCRTGSPDSGSFPLKWNHHSSQQLSRTLLCLILSNNCISHGAGLCELGWNTDISLQTTIKLLMLGTSATPPWFPAWLLHTRAWPARCVSLTYRKRFIFTLANLQRVSNGNCGASVSVSPARLVDELLQPCFDLIIGEESHVPRVSNSQAVPISQQGGPRLHTHTHTKINVNSMKGICPHTVYELKTKSNL